MGHGERRARPSTTSSTTDPVAWALTAHRRRSAAGRRSRADPALVGAQHRPIGTAATAEPGRRRAPAGRIDHDRQAVSRRTLSRRCPATTGSRGRSGQRSAAAASSGLSTRRGRTGAEAVAADAAAESVGVPAGVSSTVPNDWSARPPRGSQHAATTLPGPPSRGGVPCPHVAVAVPRTGHGASLPESAERRRRHPQAPGYRRRCHGPDYDALSPSAPRLAPKNTWARPSYIRGWVSTHPRHNRQPNSRWLALALPSRRTPTSEGSGQLEYYDARRQPAHPT